MSSQAGAAEDGPVRQIQDMGEATVVKLGGEIDMYCSPVIRQTLLAATAKEVPSLIIDTSEVSHMDSSGVATLVEALQRVKRYRGRLVLVGMQDRVRSVFEIAKLTDLFEIKPTLEEALGDG